MTSQGPGQRRIMILRKVAVSCTENQSFGSQKCPEVISGEVSMYVPKIGHHQRGCIMEGNTEVIKAAEDRILYTTITSPEP
jgi:hypothetical protein